MYSFLTTSQEVLFILYYLNPLLEGGVLYSCDSPRYSFESPDVDTAESFLSFLSHLPGCTHYHSLKDFDYRYLFVLGTKGLSFSVGFCTNGVKKETVLQGSLDSNPNRIPGEITYDGGLMRTSAFPFDQEEVEYRGLQSQARQFLRTVLNELFLMAGTIRIKRWDLAADVLCGRDCVQLIKDNRKYSQLYKSAQGFTEYLGCMSAPGRIRVYNKWIETDLDHPLTRIEVTLDSLDYVDCCRYRPNVCTREMIDLAKSRAMVQPLAEQPVDRMDYYLHQMSAPMKRRYKALPLGHPFEVEGSMPNKSRSQLLRYREGNFYE